MYKRRISLNLIKSFFCFIFIVSTFADKECDEIKCPGPLRFYADLKCKPIYKNPEDCCAVKYDCSHLKGRSKTKCYVNDNVYEIGESLKEEDALPCDINCVCSDRLRGIASFECAIVDCFHERPKPGCYLEHSGKRCCSGPEICPTNPVTCLVDGKTLKEGDYFKPKDKPNTSCYCKPGYKGENVEPFCHTPQTSCSVSYRCQNKNDTLISHPETRNQPDSDETNTCKFGNIVMQIGDELNQATDYSSVCVKCKCEVPPIPTCQRLSDDECDVTIHPKFES
ncbi:kielin/chordin-like protein isoform X2 [Leptopilina boulardi]|uniref:kielin/chordin-like protein isoform X2 n=1 Tax=Leptopilina boulardi TaxID=63433 RepID=UPI0021F5AB48|nr:kielin/chordin-like protein isoform X2 [Leptopilina boulardi]